jgi:sialidase-1
MNAQTNTPAPRRQFLKSTAALAAGAAFVRPRSLSAATGTILETKIISKQPEYYHGWSTVARRANGELWLTWSGGRVSHVCPFGQVVAMTSRDEGATWSWPRVLLDSAIDDRDSGVLETAKGTLIASTFTSLAYESYFEKKQVFSELTKGGWQTQELANAEYERWRACHERLSAEERKADLGEWIVRSTDGGASWSARIPTIVNSPHGPIQLKDGRLFYAGKQLWTDDKKIGVAVSEDDGLTWSWLSEIPTRPGDDATKSYHELHAVEADDGTIIAQIRNHNQADSGWTLQTESKDGGKTWSEPHPITFGLPSHLLKLRDGRLLMSYGHRRAPFGNQARVSSDHGKTWSDPMVISGDGIGGDLGYPSTVELTDGTLLTVWYESMAGQKHAVLRQATWRLG